MCVAGVKGIGAQHKLAKHRLDFIDTNSYTKCLNDPKRLKETRQLIEHVASVAEASEETKERKEKEDADKCKKGKRSYSWGRKEDRAATNLDCTCR